MERIPPISSNINQPENNRAAKDAIKKQLLKVMLGYCKGDKNIEQLITDAKKSAIQSDITQPSQEDFDNLICLVKNRDTDEHGGISQPDFMLVDLQIKQMINQLS